MEGGGWRVKFQKAQRNQQKKISSFTKKLYSKIYIDLFKNNPQPSTPPLHSLFFILFFQKINIIIKRRFFIKIEIQNYSKVMGDISPPLVGVYEGVETPLINQL